MIKFRRVAHLQTDFKCNDLSTGLSRLQGPCSNIWLAGENCNIKHPVCVGRNSI